MAEVSFTMMLNQSAGFVPKSVMLIFLLEPKITIVWFDHCLDGCQFFGHIITLVPSYNFSYQSLTKTQKKHGNLLKNQEFHSSSSYELEASYAVQVAVSKYH